MKMTKPAATANIKRALIHLYARELEDAAINGEREAVNAFYEHILRLLRVNTYVAAVGELFEYVHSWDPSQRELTEFMLFYLVE